MDASCHALSFPVLRLHCDRAASDRGQDHQNRAPSHSDAG